jgi:hypothetical protein
MITLRITMMTNHKHAAKQFSRPIVAGLEFSWRTFSRQGT